ncbi:hypothetical protein HLH10_16150 [Acinetobacter sp. ANC 4277]|uniref:hypothetical protein n=1 Tax=Acinetobacter terrae TaxID=2731247 RepID=UPI00148F5EE0|nr:hypothetical protein [Acinetobacter terrae]NNG77749.1 hypothetical protein [Acinetobacter terrae]
MLTKSHLTMTNTAYFCSTGARLAPLHPSPVVIYQAASQLVKVSTKSIEKALNGSNAPIMQAIQTLPWLNNAPWFNGNMSNINFHPLITQFCNLAHQSYPGSQAPSLTINPSNVIYMVEQLRFFIQTMHYGDSLEKWMAIFNLSKQALNETFRAIEKNVSGFELQDFCINYDASQNGSLQMEDLKTLISNEIKLLLNQDGPDKCLAILLKKEPCLNQRINLRYIVVLQKDFIDESIGFTDFGFFKILKNTVESNSCYTITYDTGLLNGFLANNRFSKKNPNYRERIKGLKTYLIGTDMLYRVDGLQPTFEVIYSKFD